MKIFNILIFAFIITFSSQVFAKSFKTEKWITKNGVTVVFYPAKEVPILNISLALAAGSAYDGKKYGLSALTTHMLNEGNAGKSSTIIAEELAETGAQFDAATSRDMIVLNLRTLTDKKALNSATTVLSHIINHPDFPDRAFEREKKQMLMVIDQTEESPDDVASLHFFQTLYQDHPYAHPINGTTATMNALTKKDIISFYKKYFVGSNALLIIVGAVTSKEAHSLADKLTQELPKGSPAPAIPKALPIMNAEKINISFPSSQTIVRLGQVGIDHHNPDYFALMVGNYILGGGSLVSRLTTEVREKRGLTYGVNSQFIPMPGDGPFLISLSTQNKEAQNALTITQDTLNHFINEGPNKNELESAKKYLMGSFPLSLASNRDIAHLLLRMAFYHLPDNYLDTYLTKINAVTGKDIKTAFKKQIDPSKLLLVTVGQS